MTIEEAKLIANILTPLAILVLGILVHRTTSKLEARQALNQKLIEARLGVFSKLSPTINQLYCYFMRIGTWKEVTPSGVIKLKRAADAEMFPFFPLFNEMTYRAYGSLFQELFAPYSGKGKDAKLRLDVSDYSIDGLPWQDEWTALYQKPEGTEEQRRQRVHMRYVALMQALAAEVGVEAKGQWTPAIPSPRNRAIDVVLPRSASG